MQNTKPNFHLINFYKIYKISIIESYAISMCSLQQNKIAK